MYRSRRLILGVIGVIVVGIVVIQIIPVTIISADFARTNPEVHTQIQWNSAQTEQIARSACYDCHSNETVWPWYSQIAPVSWLVAKDVNEGREALNFSEQSANQIDPEELVEEIEEGAMPPTSYTTLHPAAQLSDEQEQILIDGLIVSLHGTESEGEAGEDGENEGSSETDDD